MSDKDIAPPLPDLTPRTAPFWSAAREGRLVVQRCGACSRCYFPPVEVCSTCLSADSLAWAEASGHGEIFSYVVMHQIYHPAFADEAPYAVVEVRLAEGPRMISRLVDCPPADVRIGMPVEVTFRYAGNDIHLPMFCMARRT